jgi:signal peptidase I
MYIQGRDRQNEYIFNYENIYVEPKFSYTEIPYKPNLMLDGYFQSEKYFKDFEKETIDLFNFSDKDVTDVKKFLSTIKNGKKITCVHVRRGDYIKYSNYHLTCDVNFYKKSMSYFTDNNFIFISDDIVWVQENFIGDNIFYSNFNDELKDLLLLILSDNLIISNSSFSWWGAYLNKNKDKNIIVPKKWFNNAGPKDQQDIIPENWITID